MFIDGYPYTNFSGINAKKGRIRLQDSTYPYGVRIELATGTNSDSEKKIYVPNATTGSTLMIKGYHMSYGTATYQRDQTIAAHTMWTGTAAITGILSTSQIFFTSMYGLDSSATNSGPLVLGGRYKSAGICNLVLYNTNTTCTLGTSVVDYILLQPQTT